MRLKRNVKSLLFRNARTSTTAELNRVNRKPKINLRGFGISLFDIVLKVFLVLSLYLKSFGISLFDIVLKVCFRAKRFSFCFGISLFDMGLKAVCNSNSRSFGITLFDMGLKEVIRYFLHQRTVV